MAPGERDGGAEAAARYRQYEYKAVRARRARETGRRDDGTTETDASIECDDGGDRVAGDDDERRRRARAVTSRIAGGSDGVGRGWRTLTTRNG